MKKLLVLASRFPYPLEKGDKLRMFKQLEGLSEHFEITLCSLTDEAIDVVHYDKVRTLCAAVHIFHLPKWKSYGRSALAAIRNSDSLQHAYFYDSKIAAHIAQIITDLKPDKIYCQLLRMSGYVPSEYQHAILDYMDAFSLGTKRRASKSSWPWKGFWEQEAVRNLNLEHAALQKFSAHTIISARDRKAIFPNGSGRAVEIIPNGVNLEYFRAEASTKEYDLVFVGNMGYLPNVEAVEYLAQRVMPKLIDAMPGIRLLIAGARPANRVKKLASKNIFVSGWLEDVRDAYNKSKVFVAPLFLGSGQQNKILEAMSMSMPCITTSIVNNSIHASDQSTVWIANTPDEFVEGVTKLLHNEQLRRSMGRDARYFVSQNYRWTDFTDRLVTVIEGA